MSAQAQDPGTVIRPTIGSASVLRHRGVATVIASGEFDAGTSGGLQAALDVAWATGAADVVVDLTGLSFMDGAVLRLIESTARVLAAEGRSLRLANPPRGVVRLLYVAGATQLLHS